MMNLIPATGNGHDVAGILFRFAQSLADRGHLHGQVRLFDDLVSPHSLVKLVLPDQPLVVLDKHQQQIKSLRRKLHRFTVAQKLALYGIELEIIELVTERTELKEFRIENGRVKGKAEYKGEDGIRTYSVTFDAPLKN